ncbi:unnamed protein product [Penicillium salamii]|uniref:Epidermal growth factor receptor-like transmembrane-juxtamembrane segment domain-containing protein n=1 Tax=Penicillium salamii TaxID=1612424 RepID=A0A9W4NK80_9EURO|nr:unnamed protein product [Penicillium salamii]CAG7980829.1 unnamed protein product [Penicillium salamii]CAG8078209.1 unnamed protein product [Penicillium salamii]CAG8081763.1 unnamed protein product [Penicillium salamii]CAG8238438.1 unnamed protein product [Penicillium salamii]
MDSIEALFPRDASACTGSKQWYVCSVGNFRGCCSSDPCATGTCPDSEDDTTSTATSLSDLSLTKTVGAINRLPNVTPRTTTTSSMTTLTEAVTFSSEDPATTAVSPSSKSTTPLTTSDHSTTTDTLTSPEATGATTLSSARAASPGAASPSSTPTSIQNATPSNRGAIIGGVLGGLAALALLAILIFCCMRRRRKQVKHGKRSKALSWNPYGRNNNDRAAGSEMKEPQSPRDSEANRSLTTSSTASPISTETRPGVHLTPNLVLTSSSTNLISPSPQKNQVPPALPLSTELYASVPNGQDFTPELQDTGFARQRAELASNPQSEWINIPISERLRQNPIRLKTAPRVWESPSLTPIAASPRESPVRESRQRQGHTRSQSETRGPVGTMGRVVTADGVVLGANLDRYSNGLEIGRSLDQERRSAEGSDSDHVMSFMQYGRSEEGVGAPVGARARSVDDLGGESSTGKRVSRTEQTVPDGDVPDEEDIPPAYEANESSLHPEIKSPSGRMEMSLRGV